MCDVPKNWTGGLNSLIYTMLSNETPLVVHGARKDVDAVLGFIKTDDEFADLHVYNMTVYNTGMITKKYKMTESVVAILAHKHLEVCLFRLLPLCIIGASSFIFLIMYRHRYRSISLSGIQPLLGFQSTFLDC